MAIEIRLGEFTNEQIGAAKLRLLAAYRVAAVFATTFGWPFGLSEQWRGRLQDRIDNARSRQ
jgi:hypothetical protein